jgi:hypothetical protein
VSDLRDRLQSIGREYSDGDPVGHRLACGTAGIAFSFLLIVEGHVTMIIGAAQDVVVVTTDEHAVHSFRARLLAHRVVPEYVDLACACDETAHDILLFSINATVGRLAASPE